jgi:glycosyltransferase involved in cell wall biosynthesis
MAKKILVYTNHYFPENFKINDIVSHFDDQKYSVKVITGIPNYPSGKIFQNYGYLKKNNEIKGNVKIRRLPLITRGKGSALRLFLNYISYFLSVLIYTIYLILFNKKYDVIFVHHTSPIFIAISPCLYKIFNKQVKMILWDLDIWPESLEATGEIKNKNILYSIKKLVEILYNKFDIILVGSNSFIEIIKKRVKNVPVIYFPNWAEDVFNAGLIDDSTTKTETQTETQTENLKIMFAGNIGEAQDVYSVLKLIDKCKNKHIDWFFVGDGRMKNWLERELNLITILGEINFLGSHPLLKMPSFFKQADIMLLSLKNDTLFSKTVPAKLQAYLGSAKPVLGMISGESKKIIVDSGAGWCSDSGDIEGAYNNICEILKCNYNQLSEKGLSGLNYYNKKFNKNLRLVQIDNIIKNI